MEYYIWVMNMDKGSESKKPKVINTLKLYREKLGVTGQEMEWRTGIGIRQWPHYEAGREPKIKLAQKFARTYNEITLEKGLDIKHLTADDLYPEE